MATKNPDIDLDDEELEEGETEEATRTPRKPRSEVLADAVNSIEDRYTALMDAIQANDDEAMTSALGELGKEAGRIRRVIRSTQKGLKAEDADSTSLFGQLLPA